MRTAVIVQARTGSSRLPGKVLKPLAGRTVLAHVLERCRAIPGADVVCCATTDRSEDDAIVEASENAGAVVVRGPEQDVLNRYAMAAEAVGADIVLRVTSDCPLIDPAVCASVLELRTSEAADFACNNMPPSWPHGLDCEVFTRQWLDRADREATAPEEREHVGPYVRSHPDARKVNLACAEEGGVHHRWTLDTPDDFAFMIAVFDRLPEGRAGWNWRIVLDIVRAEPTLSSINAEHARAAG